MDEENIQTQISEELDSAIRTETIESYYDYESSEVYSDEFVSEENEESKKSYESYESEEYKSDFDFTESEAKRREIIEKKIGMLKKIKLLENRKPKKYNPKMKILKQKIEFLKLDNPKIKKEYSLAVDPGLVSKLNFINIMSRTKIDSDSSKLEKENELLSKKQEEVRLSQFINRQYNKLTNKLAI
ncbi:unnamed protein product [Blepharisma stoltei]|uniref:Uncharacterized protein n=1 Tax=Blepharisma stoltei TaxID=1481888 RepID=A0AAU9K211_9CILI|nr:unnamed protein product [Blepharisma stoltei]